MTRVPNIVKYSIRLRTALHAAAIFHGVAQLRSPGAISSLALLHESQLAESVWVCPGPPQAWLARSCQCQEHIISQQVLWHAFIPANRRTLYDCRLWADVCGPEAPQCQVCGGVAIEVSHNMCCWQRGCSDHIYLSCHKCIDGKHGHRFWSSFTCIP